MELLKSANIGRGWGVGGGPGAHIKGLQGANIMVGDVLITLTVDCPLITVRANHIFALKV